MPTKVTQGQSKRDEIVEIASRLFYEQGFGATGIKQIIDEAGIAKGTFYSHFQSKDELGLAWLKARHAVWNGWFEDSVEQSDAAAGILASFDFLEKWLEESSFRGCAFLNTMAEIPGSGEADAQRSHGSQNWASRTVPGTHHRPFRETRPIRSSRRPGRDHHLPSF